MLKSCFCYRIYHSKIINYEKNRGNADRIIRLLVAAAITILFFANMITGTVGIVLLVLAAIFVLTGLVGFFLFML
jgi:hypothetical protein